MMKHQHARNTALALVGLLALTVYILACTSFSPDDTKVLYPAFSGANGAMAVASYDRAARRSEIVFAPAILSDLETNAAPLMVRGQWLGDGDRILATWVAKENNNTFNLAVLPFGARGPVQLFTLTGADLATSVMLPAPIVGDRVFMVDAPNKLVRLDLRDGSVARHELGKAGAEWVLYPAADGKGLFYLQDPKSTDGRTFGRLDPESFALTPILTFTNPIENGFSFTYDLSGNRVAIFEKDGDHQRLVILERGKAAYTRPIPGSGSAFELGNAIFSRGGDTLLASYRRQQQGTAAYSFGLIEIPLRDQPPRETELIPACNAAEDGVTYYFQIGLSHDGKSAAVASTYLACMSENFKPEDCALFFIDLSDTNRKVTKVPIPMPAGRTWPVK